MTKQKMQLLIIEDAAAAIESWKEDIAEHNADADKTIEFEYKFASNSEEAKRLLSQDNFKFIVADIRIPLSNNDTEPKHEHGNAVISSILNTYPAMTAVMSGHPGELVSDGYQVKFFVRGDVGTPNTNKLVLDWFEENRELALILDSILSEAKSLMAKFFHKSVSPRWADHWKSYVDVDTLKSIITRQAASYVSEEITHAPDGKLFHYEEFYISPAIRLRLHTGDLIKEDGDKYSIVLSPPCDMRRTYPKGILIAPCDVCDNSLTTGDWSDYQKLHASTKVDAEEKRLKRIKNLINQNIDNSTHFLPPLKDEGPWVISFGNVITRPDTDAAVLLSKRIASVSPYFIPNILQRFASYIGRLGQPDMDHKYVQDAINRILPKVVPADAGAPVAVSMAATPAPAAAVEATKPTSDVGG